MTKSSLEICSRRILTRVNFEKVYIGFDFEGNGKELRATREALYLYEAEIECDACEYLLAFCLDTPYFTS